MITLDNIVPPETVTFQFTHDPSIDPRYVVIMQPCKNILVGCNERFQAPPSSVLLEGGGETLPQNLVWHLEFSTHAVNVLASFTTLYALTCLISPFVLPFNFVLYVTDCVSVILSIWVLINVLFAKPRIITSLDQYRRQELFGNVSNCTDMIYSMCVTFVFTVLVLKNPTDSSLNYSYRSIGYVCKVLVTLWINMTSKVTTYYTT